MDDLVERLRDAAGRIGYYNGKGQWEPGAAGIVAEAVDRILLLQEFVSAGEALANAVGPLVDDSMERNGPQVSSDIVEAYRDFRACYAKEESGDR